MADWSTIETALGGWVNTITGLPIQWRGRPRSPTFHDAGYALLQITGRRTKGIRDDLQYDYDDTKPNGEEIRYYQSGQRVFTLTIQIRTDRQSVDNDAKHYTSLIRDRVRLPQISHAVFKGADIAFNAILNETDLPDLQDGRMKSVAQIDIAFNATSIVEDTGQQWIETVEDAKFQVPAGTTVWTGDIPVD